MRAASIRHRGTYKVELHADEAVALLVACDDAIQLGADHGGVLSRLATVLSGVRPVRRERADLPLVMIGPGGDYVRSWPGEQPVTRESLTAELVGGPI